MKRIFVSVFAFCALLALGGWISVSAEMQDESNQQKPPDARISPGTNPPKPRTREQFLQDISLLENRLRRLDGVDRETTPAGKLLTRISDFKARLREKVASPLSDADARTNASILEGFYQEFNLLSQQRSSAADPAAPKVSETATANTTPREKDLAGGISSEADSDDWLWFLLKWVSLIVAGALVVGGGIWTFLFLRRKKERERTETRVGFSDLKNRNTAFNQRLDELTKITTDLSQQIAQQKSEIGRLKQNIVDPTTASYPPPPPVASYPKEQPRFPVSVADYLAKIGQGATPVKYDYKEGMLVPDATNEGGLTIIQDDGQLNLIPSFGFFQTKSDYTNYFERYYACARPMGGNVWIRQPATVSQVAGGWQLASQGELEVR